MIATDIDGIKEYFEDVALLIPPQNSNELASAITKVLDKPKLARRIGEKGRSLVESKFTWQQHIAGVLSLYDEIRHKRQT